MYALDSDDGTTVLPAGLGRLLAAAGRGEKPAVPHRCVEAICEFDAGAAALGTRSPLAFDRACEGIAGAFNTLLHADDGASSADGQCLLLAWPTDAPTEAAALELSSRLDASPLGRVFAGLAGAERVIALHVALANAAAQLPRPNVPADAAGVPAAEDELLALLLMGIAPLRLPAGHAAPWLDVYRTIEGRLHRRVDWLYRHLRAEMDAMRTTAPKVLVQFSASLDGLSRRIAAHRIAVGRDTNDWATVDSALTDMHPARGNGADGRFEEAAVREGLRLRARWTGPHRVARRRTWIADELGTGMDKVLGTLRSWAEDLADPLADEPWRDDAVTRVKWIVIGHAATWLEEAGAHAARRSARRRSLRATRIASMKKHASHLKARLNDGVRSAMTTAVARALGGADGLSEALDVCAIRCAQRLGDARRQWNAARSHASVIDTALTYTRREARICVCGIDADAYQSLLIETQGAFAAYHAARAELGPHKGDVCPRSSPSAVDLRALELELELGLCLPALVSGEARRAAARRLVDILRAVSRRVRSLISDFATCRLRPLERAAAELERIARIAGQLIRDGPIRLGAWRQVVDVAYLDA